eukprot:GHVU01170850.1.p1 GENE.GHVU01170850.1~~GHVU01170850.1.p1  ORF type:complete len:375 (+),score=66.22 GHVU01170850.1:182-1306(+)
MSFNEFVDLPVHQRAVQSKRFGDAACGFWQIKLYPGACGGAADNLLFSEQTAPEDPGQDVRVFLCLATNLTPRAKAEFVFYVVDPEGNKVPGTEKKSKSFVEFSSQPNQDCFGFNTFCRATDLPRLTFGDTFSIKLEINVYLGIESGPRQDGLPLPAGAGASNGRSAPPPGGDESAPGGGLKESVVRLASDKAFHDVTVHCGDEPPISACKFMLAARSQVFHMMFKSQYRDAKSSKVDMTDVGRRVAEDLLSYIHTDTCRTLESNPVNVREMLDLFLAANKYQISCLEELCVETLLPALDKKNVLEVLQVAEQVQTVVEGGGPNTRIEDTPGHRLKEGCRKLLNNVSAWELLHKLPPEGNHHRFGAGGGQPGGS